LYFLKNIFLLGKLELDILRGIDRDCECVLWCLCGNCW